MAARWFFSMRKITRARSTRNRSKTSSRRPCRSRPNKAKARSASASRTPRAHGQLRPDEQELVIQVRGGDATKASDPTSWPATVKPAKNWEVIGREKLKPIVEWLPEDLRKRLMIVWSKVPVAPAVIFGSFRRCWRRTMSARRSKPNSFSGRGTSRTTGTRARGDVQLVCGASLTPDLSIGDAGGRASFHRYRNGDCWTDTSSVCLPVPAGHRYAAKTADTWADNGKAPVRFAIAETNLTLGKWISSQERPGVPNDREFQAQTDGFVFCSVEASNDGDRGYVECKVDKILIAAASVHNYAHHNCWIRYASFCAPFAKGSTVEIQGRSNKRSDEIERLADTEHLAGLEVQES